MPRLLVAASKRCQTSVCEGPPPPAHASSSGEYPTAPTRGGLTRPRSSQPHVARRRKHFRLEEPPSFSSLIWREEGCAGVPPLPPRVSGPDRLPSGQQMPRLLDVESKRYQTPVCKGLRPPRTTRRRLACQSKLIVFAMSPWQRPRVAARLAQGHASHTRRGATGSSVCGRAFFLDLSTPLLRGAALNMCSSPDAAESFKNE